MKKIYEEPSLEMIKFAFNSEILLSTSKPVEEDLSGGGFEVGGPDDPFAGVN